MKSKNQKIKVPAEKNKKAINSMKKEKVPSKKEMKKILDEMFKEWKQSK